MWQMIVQSLTVIGSSPLFSAGRDLLSIFLAIMAIVLSWRAFKMGKDQGRIIDKQVELMTLEVETGKRIEAITKRQGEIAEVQHQIVVEQRAKRPELVLDRGATLLAEIDEENGTRTERVLIEIQNDGSLAARDIRWHFRAQSVGSRQPVVRPSAGNEDIRKGWEIDDDMCHVEYISGLFRGPLYPGQYLPLLRVSLRVPIAEFSAGMLRDAEYWLACDDARFPPKGFQKMRLDQWACETRLYEALRELRSEDKSDVDNSESTG